MLSTLNMLECLRFCLLVLLSCYWTYFYVFTLCVMVQESVQTLSTCPSQERSVTMYYLCLKELVHRNDLSSSPISSAAANQSTELVDLKLISWNLNSFLLTLFFLLGEQWMVLFSSQSAQGWVLSTSGSTTLGCKGWAGTRHPLTPGFNSMLSPLQLSHKYSGGLKYGVLLNKK